MQNQYFYRLGHQPKISQAEFSFLTRDKDFEDDHDYILSDSYLDIHTTGSLVYAGKNLKVWQKDIQDISVEEVCRFLKIYIETAITAGDNLKKLGLVLPEAWHARVLSTAKAAGAKKINIIPFDKNLNYGHWKQTKNWLLFFGYKDSVVLGRVTHFSDQEFWQNLDTRLPAGEMSRGLINLKLARTLLNLTDKKIIWDPFCGHGRILVSGIDLKSEFFASDVDADELKADVVANFDYATNYWAKYGFWQRDDKEPTLAKLAEVFTLDATQVSYKHFAKELDLKNMAIVTEGYLGKNFKMQPSRQQIEKEWEVMETLWRKTILEAKKQNITEIIFCLPFYQHNQAKLLPDFISRILGGSGYESTDFGGQNFLLYSRKDSFVGHYIVKLVKFLD
jgi:hypothetical protein